MNLDKNGLIRLLSLLLFLVVLGNLHAMRLNIYYDHNRFLDSEGNTVHHFNYKIPNNELSFGETEDGFVALLDVMINVEQEEGKLTKLEEFTRYIGVKDKDAAISATKYFLDKISLTLSKAEIKLHIKFEDRISGRSYSWLPNLENLEAGALISDIEFSHLISKDEHHHSMEEFMRGEYLFYVDPAHIYYKDVHDSVYYYYEIQNIFLAGDGFSYVSETINIQSEKDTLLIEKHLKGKATVFDRIHSIPLKKLDQGYYNIDITIHDRFRNVKENVKDYFVIASIKDRVQRLFYDEEQEYTLLRYFLPSTYFRNWETMSADAKNNLIDRFWRQNDPNPHIDHNEFLHLIKQRVNYANSNFAHFREGWLTDLGRIHIRNGSPDEIDKGHLEGDISLTRREYQIWRYRNLNRVYLFVDIQGTGNYRLIYNKNDDMEPVAHDWERFVGPEFDQQKLDQ